MFTVSGRRRSSRYRSTIDSRRGFRDGKVESRTDNPGVRGSRSVFGWGRLIPSRQYSAADTVDGSVVHDRLHVRGSPAERFRTNRHRTGSRRRTVYRSPPGWFAYDPHDLPVSVWRTSRVQAGPREGTRDGDAELEVPGLRNASSGDDRRKDQPSESVLTPVPSAVVAEVPPVAGDDRPTQTRSEMRSDRRPVRREPAASIAVFFVSTR